MKKQCLTIVLIFLGVMIFHSCYSSTSSKAREAGKEFFRQADYENSIRQFTKAINQERDYWKLYYYRSLAYQKLNQTDLAINDLDKVLELLPEIKTWNFKFPTDKWAEIYVIRGMLFHQKTDYDPAIADFDKAIEKDPNSKGAYYYRALSKEAVGKYQEALTDYTQTINMDAGFMSGVSDNEKAQAYLGRANLYRKLNKTDLALADNEKALTIRETWEAFLSRGTTLAKMERFGEAIKDFSKTLELNPSSETAYLYRASSRMLSTCDLKKILDDYYSLVAIETIDDETLQLGYNQIAWILATAENDDIRDGKKALHFAKKSVALNRDFIILDTLAVAYAECGEYEQAVETLNQAIKLCETESPELLPDLEKHLELFLHKNPIREKCPGAKSEFEQLRKWQGQ